MSIPSSSQSLEAPRPPRRPTSASSVEPDDGLRSQLEAIQQLERRLERHRQRAVGQIATTYTQGLLRLCEARLGSREAAEEVVQDVLSRVPGQLGRVEGEEHLRNLLFRMAKNQCIEVAEALRREQRLRSVLESDSPDGENSEGERSALREAISALPKLEDRILVTLAMDYRLPLKNIAAVLEISEGACKMRSHRARIKLRKILESGGI